MKKVLIIGLTERMGGVETFIYNTTRFSNREKYEYDFLVHGTEKTVFQDEISEFYGDSAKHFYYVTSLKKNPIKSFKELSRFYKEHGNDYDYVHLQTGATSEIVYVFPFSLFYRFKVISHSHNGNGYSPVVNRLFRLIVNMISYKELSCSAEATEWLFGKSKKNKVEIINNGIDTRKFTFNSTQRKELREKYGISEETFVVGHIGRFSEQKNHKMILKIFSEILKLREDSVLMLVGAGELKDIVEKKAHELGLAKNIIFCGLQSKTNKYYSAFDVFLMPSLYEGLPIVGIEAQSEGLPCFFSRNVSEQICITDNAHLIPLEESADNWAKLIVNSKCKNREKYAKLVHENGYSIQSTVNTLEKVYEV
ncbi:glycosyltransferase [Ligilactobacillus agilis]|nr:glycosyltransferase [Ligilactobacillus agilis]